LAWSSVFDESVGGGSDGSSATECTPLAAPSADEFSSFLPQSAVATSVFTGVACDAINGCAATPTDTWTTTVNLPGASQATTATLIDTVATVACAPDLLTCSTSTVTIPGTFANLLITLRRDATTIANGAKIANAQIVYDNPAHPDPRIAYPLTLLSCEDTTWGPLPQSGIPCVNLRTAYPKKSTPKRPVPAGYEGDWEFLIKAIDNGRFTN
jgi:hypothetical protein